MSRYDVLFMNGKSLMFWALEWFSMSNDAFFACYGFNFNPHHYPGLYEQARARYFFEEGPAMMREEAIERIGEQYKVCKEFYHLSANPEKDYPSVMSYMEALDLSLSALRPVSREQVEKVWKGEWIALDECANEGVYCSKCKKKVYRIEYANEKMKSSFCPHCGAPMTDEAVQMVMERLEALHEIPPTT